MANYVSNILKCSRITASKFLTTEEDGYLYRVDFRKAFNIPPEDYNFVFIDYSWEIYIDDLPDDRVMIRFETRGYEYYREEIRRIITAFHDIVWYCIEENIVEEGMFYWDHDHVEERTRDLFQNEYGDKTVFDIRYECYDQVTPEKEIIFYADRQDLVIEDFYENVSYLYHISRVDTMQIRWQINSYFENSIMRKAYNEKNGYIGYAYKSSDEQKEISISLYALGENNEKLYDIYFDIDVCNREYMEYTENDNYGKVIINQLEETIDMLTGKYERTIILNYTDSSNYSD